MYNASGTSEPHNPTTNIKAVITSNSAYNVVDRCFILEIMTFHMTNVNFVNNKSNTCFNPSVVTNICVCIVLLKTFWNIQMLLKCTIFLPLSDPHYTCPADFDWCLPPCYNLHNYNFSHMVFICKGIIGIGWNLIICVTWWRYHFITWNSNATYHMMVIIFKAPQIIGNSTVFYNSSFSLTKMKRQNSSLMAICEGIQIISLL